MKWLSNCISMVLCILFTSTADISVSGTVKKTDGITGIAGVKVSLLNQNELFSITDTNGNFNIWCTSLRSHQPKDNTVRISVKDRTLYFSPIGLKQHCKIGIYSVIGKNLL